ncbi:Fe-S-binding domain-containing protein [Streptomyces sp. NBC_00322]|uniref:NADH-ubiquinone oxidoreductase-F iron-sulfur binding region domain-containing protein n=1 Tax=Streptomyces sp. NBC_00322 TaxID=2975712 RepID=UPI002E2B864B|nr:NADH-ubiquinone oxidoreductase-F iron-sulfur binding region domain-containing protein [Streptomyces sp. NBC_00322]
MPGGPGTLLGPAPEVTEDAEAYAATGGYRDTADPAKLLDLITDAGLLGRGGAGFPAAIKLAAVRDGTGVPVVVANGEEGEPGSVKDRWLLRARPHLVLDGLALAAAITGAEHGYVYLSDPCAATRVRRALAERPTPLPVEVIETDHTYVGGEETAAVRRINGGPALPTAKPPRPFERGVADRPTLVCNVETLARIALIAAHPHLRHRIAHSTLLTLSTDRGAADDPCEDPLLSEVPYGTTLGTLAAELGAADASGALMGGLFGGLVGPGWPSLPLDHAALAGAGTALGCGAIRFLAPGACPVAVAADAVDHLTGESARQCGVCVSGTTAIRDTLRALTTGTAGPDAAERLERWSKTLPGRGACGLLDAAAGTAGSLLRAFPALVRSHLDTPCPLCAACPPRGGHRLVVAVPHVADAASATEAVPSLKGTA